MVWGLFPVDPLPGEEKYYIFKKGTFKVGRKGCDVIANKDKGVSRVHAEIIVNLTSTSSTQAMKNPGASRDVVIRDCSKYGTFINKNLESQEKVHELPRKEITLRMVILSLLALGVHHHTGEHVEEAANEEKKRKQLEALAEELFNNDKGRQRKLAGTLCGIFTRS